MLGGAVNTNSLRLLQASFLISIVSAASADQTCKAITEHRNPNISITRRTRLPNLQASARATISVAETFPASLPMLPMSGAMYKIKTSEMPKPITVESTSHLRDRRAHRQAAIAAVNDNRKNKGLSGKKNGNPPSVGMAL